MRSNARIKYLRRMILLVMICIMGGMCTGRVEAANKKITLSKQELVLCIGQSKKLSVKNAKGKKIRWKSSKKKVASVSGNGTIKAKKAGKTVITATIGRKKLRCTVQVQKAKISESSIIIDKNERYKLSVSCTEKKTWSAKNSSIVSVDQKGNICGLKAGTTKIILKSKTHKLVCKVRVEEPTISRQSVILETGNSAQLSMLHTIRTVTWTSEQPNVATVTSDGFVTGKNRGTTTVIAQCGNKTYRCSIVVMGAQSSFKSIAHRGYAPSDSSGSCRLSAYRSAADHGFNYVEADIQFTKDEVPVCCHGASFLDSVTGEKIVIGQYTLQELKTYNYYGEPIATLEEVMALCSARGLGLYIDKTENITGKEERLTTVMELIDQYRMQTKVTFLVTSIEQGNAILERNPKASLSALMVNAITLQSCITTANALKTDLNTVSIDLAVKRISMAELIAAASKVKPGITFEVWSVNNSSDYKALLPYLSGITSDRLCLADIL